MEVLVVLLFFATPALAVVAAIVGVRALWEPVPDFKRLRLAAAIVAVPWMFVVLFAGEYAGQFVDGVARGPHALSPLVAAGLAIGWWWRRPPTPAPEPRDEAPAYPGLAVRDRTALVSELRFPDLKPSAVALAVVLPIVWWMAMPSSRGGGHSNPVGGIAGQILVAVATLGVASLAVLFAIAFATRPAAAVASTYSWLALASGAGMAALWIAGYWREAAETPYLHYEWAGVLMWLGVAAVLPAVVGQLLHMRRERSSTAPPAYPVSETGQPIPLSDGLRFLWLALVPALPALVAVAVGVLLFLVDRLRLGVRWYAITEFAFLWTSIGPGVIVISAGIGWIAVRNSSAVYQQRWKHLTITCVAGWFLLYLIMP